MPTPRPVICGYYADFLPAPPPSGIDYSLFTVINHAFAEVDRNGALTFPDLAKSRDLCARAHAAGVRVLLSVGGADSGGGFSRATATERSLSHTANALANAMERAGYDGFDVDWEFPTNPTERERMNSLVRALRTRLPQASITMAAPATHWSGKWFVKEALLPYLDRVNVMTYDFHGEWSDHAGFNAPLRYSASDGHPDCRENTVEASVDYWLKRKQWPPEKLLLGIPLYGRGFRASGWGAPASGSYKHSYLGFNDINSLVPKGWRQKWDETAAEPYLSSPKRDEWITFDNAQSIKRKSQWARQRGLGGVFFWEISQDYDGRSNPLVRAARSAWG